MTKRLASILCVLVTACARESRDVAPVATVATVSTVPMAASISPPAVLASSSVSAPVPQREERSPNHHDECCKQPSDCGDLAVCSPYPFNVAHHCARVCRNQCKTTADCPPRAGSPSNLSCQSGLCEVPSPGS